MKFPLGWLLLNRWFWIIILGCWAVVIGPLIVMSIMISLPAPLNALGVFGLIIGWSVASGYKDWVQARRQEQKFHPEKSQT